MELHYEDALKFLVESLGRSPNAFSPGGVPPSYDVWIPRCVAQFLVASSVDTRGDPEFSHRSEFEKVWTAFYDAAWQLCRRGIFRLSQTRPEGMGTSYGPLGDGYAVTEAGREWLKTAQLRYFPSEPGRYVQVLQQPARVLGDGFLQRAGEAAGCHDFGNYLACCAMCGAAAESALLAIASQKTGDEDSVLKTYNKRDGRRN